MTGTADTWGKRTSKHSQTVTLPLSKGEKFGPSTTLPLYKTAIANFVTKSPRGKEEDSVPNKVWLVHFIKFLFVFSKFQVSEVFDVPPVLVNR